MPQFNPNQTKTAIAPMTNPSSSGFDYTAELYLGADKAASSGRVNFSLAGKQTKSISFPMTMPSEPATYPVYLDVFSAGQLLGAYQATEDVVIIPAAKILRLTTSFGSFEILSIFGRNITDISGSKETGWEVKLAEPIPIVTPNMKMGIPIKLRNISIQDSGYDWVPEGIVFRAQFFGIGMAGRQLYYNESWCHNCSHDCTETSSLDYTGRTPSGFLEKQPNETTITLWFEAPVNFWCSGTYTILIHHGLHARGDPGGATVGSHGGVIFLRDIVHCTSNGYRYT